MNKLIIAALDIARKTKGVSEEVLSKCIDELAAAEEEVEGTRRDEARLGSLLKTESVSLIEIQKRCMQVKMLQPPILSYPVLS